MSSIDIYVPSYNYGRYLPQCIDSILRQPGVDVRALILDDCSTDDTPDVASRLARGDSRVTYRRHEQNLGHIATYNEGIAWAEADYVLLLSADDLLTDGALLRAVTALDNTPAAAMACGRQILFQDQIVPADVARVDEWSYRTLSSTEFIEQCCATGQNPVATPTTVTRTAVQRLVGGYRPELPQTGDFEMWLRLAGYGSICMLDAPQAYKRWHCSNMNWQYLTNALPDFRNRRDAFRSAFNDIRAMVPDSDRLERLAWERLAWDAMWRASFEFDEGRVDTSDELANAALELHPAIAASREWRRFSFKRRLGTRAWRGVKPVVDLLRGGASVHTPPTPHAPGR